MNLDWIISDIINESSNSNFKYSMFFNTYFFYLSYVNYSVCSTISSILNSLCIDLVIVYYYKLNLIILDFFNNMLYLESGYVKKNYNLFFNNYYIYYSFVFNWSVIYSLKFSASILFLIFIRAGVPRYRYDYITKLGWSKFVIFTLYILIITYLIFILF